MGKTLVALTLAAMLPILSILPAKSKAEVSFPTTEPWNQPRLKATEGGYITDYDNVPIGWYRFYVRLTGEPLETTKGDFIMRTELPELGNSQPFYLNLGLVKLPGSGVSTRYRTISFPIKGDYILYSSIGDEEEISRDITVTPEPAALTIAALGGLAILRRNRRMHNLNNQSRKEKN